MSSFRERSRVLRLDSSDSRFRIIRSAVDWAVFVHSDCIPESRYGTIIGDSSDVLIGGVRHHFKAWSKPSNIVLSSDYGWYARVTDPGWQPPKNMPKPYPIEIQARGRAWASGVQIFDALDDWVEFLEVKIRREDWVPGRIDLAADVWIRDVEGYPDSGELYRLIICEGNDRNIPEMWTTKSSALNEDGKVELTVDRNDQDEVIDYRFAGRGARTMYLGSRRGIQLAIYDKTWKFAGNTSELLVDEWKEEGWEPENGMIARFEFSISRKTIRELDFPVRDSEGRVMKLPGNEIKAHELFAAIPDLWRTCLRRFRLTPWDGKTNLARQRRQAPLWCRLSLAAPYLRGPGYGVRLCLAKKDWDVERLKRDARHALLNVREAAGAFAPVEVWRRSMQDSKENREYLRKTRWRGYREKWNDYDYGIDGRIAKTGENGRTIPEGERGESKDRQQKFEY